jgi:hypothetical protein
MGAETGSGWSSSQCTNVAESADEHGLGLEQSVHEGKEPRVHSQDDRHQRQGVGLKALHVHLDLRDATRKPAGSPLVQREVSSERRV